MNREHIARQMQAGEWPAAIHSIDHALALEPRDARLAISRAQCLLALGRRSEACAAAAQAERDARPDPILFDAIGSLFSQANDQLRALAAYERAVALAPDDAHFLFNRATVNRFLGRLAEAEADYDQVIALKPGDYEAYKNRSELRTQSAAANHIEQLEALVARGIADWRGAVQIRYALAKECEDVGRHADSFRHLRHGAALRRQHMQYDVATDVATVDWIIDAFPAAPAEAAAAQTADATRALPIFIVGLPRSGTTLVERILSIHSEVVSAGELNEFALSIVAAVRRENASPVPRRELIARAARLDFDALGREYLERARRTTTNACFIDKMPLNYLYCGLIRRALPQAKIIHLTRQPMAACYAMYKTLFKDAYPFSYDLTDIGRYYLGYRRLMDHWQTTLPGAIHTVSYEALVADQAHETRRLLDFCGLQWQDACLEFHRNAAPSTTASAVQVRRPLYGTSIAQWRHYAAELAPLERQLRAGGIETGGEAR